MTKTMTMTTTTTTVLLLFMIRVVASMTAADAGQPQTPYLKEVLMGLCYKRPPSPKLSPDQCPGIVGSIMGTIEGKLDHSIVVADYDFYVKQADLSSTPGHAMLWMVDDASVSSRVCTSTMDAWTQLLGKETVQTTPGGTLFRGLVFCGVDQKNKCPGVKVQGLSNSTTEMAGAQTAAWAALFQAFAKNISGHLDMVLMPKGLQNSCKISSRGATVNPLWIQQTVIPFLQADAISNVTIYLVQEEDLSSSTCRSSSVVELLQSSLHNAGILSVSCIDDPNALHSLLCSTNPSSKPCQWLHGADVKTRTGGASSKAAHEYSPNSNHESTLQILLLVVMEGSIVVGLYHWKRQKEQHHKNDEFIPFAQQQQRQQ